MKTNEQLINNIIGQLNGVKKMMESEKKCSDVIIQLKAVKAAFNTLAARFITDSFVNCYSDIPKKEKEHMQKLLIELTKIS